MTRNYTLTHFSITNIKLLLILVLVNATYLQSYADKAVADTRENNKNAINKYYWQPEDIITNLSANSTKSYVLTELISGTNLFSDRAYQIIGVPAAINNAAFVRTPNDDKKSTVSSLISFQLPQQSVLYVAYDPRATTLPAWLSGWEKLTEVINTNDPGINYMSLYRKSFPAGTVTLGGNLASPAKGSLMNYLVFATANVTPPTACAPISTLPCEQVAISLPLNLTFDGSVTNSIPDKNSSGTGFTMVDNYSGSRLSADATPSNTQVPGYEVNNLTLSSGKLQYITNKGIAYRTSNNQLNALGVKFNSSKEFIIETTIINPINGSQSQQAGLWFGLNDKSYIKLIVTGNKLHLRREINDVSNSVNADVHSTATIDGLQSQILRLRLLVNPANSTVEGFYSLDGVNFINVGDAYSPKTLSIAGINLASGSYAGIFGTHSNADTPVMYTFDDFSIKHTSTPTTNQPPAFTATNYSFNLSDNAAVNTFVGKPSATDVNGDALVYSITNGNTNGALAINGTTGNITLAKKLNFHTQSRYTLTVRVADADGLTDQASVIVNVNDGSAVPAFATTTWSTVASQPYTVGEAQGEAVNGKLYSFGGFDSQKSGFTPTSRTYAYNPSTNAWTALAPMPSMNNTFTTHGGSTHSGFTSDGTDIYFAGGYTSNAGGTGQIFGTKEAWKYIIAENRYERLPDLPITISAGQLEYLNGKLHHISGTNSSRTTDLGNHYVLNLDNLAAGWQTLAPLPNPRQHAASAVFNGKIYFIGGQTGHDSNLITQKDVHVYDATTNTWTKMADLPAPTGANGRGHISSSAIVAGNRIIVLGGEIAHGSRTNMVSAYTPATNTWENLNSLPAARFSGVAGFIGGQIYYSGGSSTSTTYKGVPNQTTNNTYMFVENLDKFSANDQLIFSNIQIPTRRKNTDGTYTPYNQNHNKVKLRIHNKGTQALVVNGITLSNSSAWKISQFNNVNYDSTSFNPASVLPITLNTRGFVDVVVEFTAKDQATRVKILNDTLYIASNDNLTPNKKLMLQGLWQYRGEGGNEPHAQEIIKTFGFKSRTGYNSHDGTIDGATIVPNSDEIIAPYFQRADASKPVYVIQMAAYHGCCSQVEIFKWHEKSSTTFNNLFIHSGLDGQSLLPRKHRNPTTAATTLSEGTFIPTGAFGIRVNDSYSDRTKNFQRKIGMRIWKAVDSKGNIIPNAYIIGTDYLGTTYTNYDYQDNIYYISNVKPEVGAAHYAELAAAPSAVYFDPQQTGTTKSFDLKLTNSGKVYSDGSSDPGLVISKVELVGADLSQLGEFSYQTPATTSLAPQASTTLTVRLSPNVRGLKNAALLVYYTNGPSPLRIPLYGVVSDANFDLNVVRRIKGAADADQTIAMSRDANGEPTNSQVWEKDTDYRKGSIKLDKQVVAGPIAGTDADVLYQTYLSAAVDLAQTRVEVPVDNGTYLVRLHLVENFFPSTGSRVVSINLENQLQVSNLDIHREVGYRTALVKDFEVVVTDGVLNLDGNPTVNRLALAGLEIYQATAKAAGNRFVQASASTVGQTQGGQLEVYPNPANRGQEVAVTLNHFKGSQKLTVELQDVLGRTLHSQPVETDGSGSARVTLSTARGQERGVYVVRVTGPGQQVLVNKLVLK